MLHEFIIANRDQIIERVQQRALLRVAGTIPDTVLQNGVPLFLVQLVTALAKADGREPALDARIGAASSIAHSSELHGHDMLRSGFTVAQVVHGYGDVCQVVTELAGETTAAIAPEEFQVFNKCLDDAIAGAVTAYGRQREQDLADEGTERLGVLAHELRNLLGTAMLSFNVIKQGTVGVSGSTGAIHSRSLARLHSLIERSLSEVRLESNRPRLQSVSLLEFLEEVEVTAALQVEASSLRLRVVAPKEAARIVIDRQLLASATSNLLQNALKFTRPQGTISLVTEVTPDRVLIEVHDECGGLPAGLADQLFRPFVQASSDRSGLGLGLSIALRAVRANGGELRVRDIPGHGCVFTIDLPREEAH